MLSGRRAACSLILALMLSKELGGVSEDARVCKTIAGICLHYLTFYAQRIATWTVIFGLLQAAVKLAKEDQQPWRLVSPAFDAGRWRLALYYVCGLISPLNMDHTDLDEHFHHLRLKDPAEADYWGASLLTADELAKPVTFSSVTMQVRNSRSFTQRGEN